MWSAAPMQFFLAPIHGRSPVTYICVKWNWGAGLGVLSPNKDLHSAIRKINNTAGCGVRWIHVRCACQFEARLGSMQ